MLGHPGWLRSFLAGVFFLIGAIGTASSETITIGTSPGGLAGENCVPFGCPNVNGFFVTTRYQQVYASSAFAAPVLVTAISFFDTFAASEGADNSIAEGIYALRFTTTAMQPGALRDDLEANVGGALATFFQGALGGPIGGSQFSIAGTPYAYDPAAGNLLLDILVSAEQSVLTSFDADFSGVLTSRASASSLGNYADGLGLVTRLTVQPIPVPEPATAALLAAGLTVVSFVRRAARMRNVATPG